MDGKLFSQDFLLDGIKETPVWQALSDDALDTFIGSLQAIYAPLQADSQLNEANTETEVIEKVLDLLGWQGLTLKQITTSASRREDVPDYLLFPNDEANRPLKNPARSPAARR